MESLVLGSWLLYALAGLVLIVASWKCLFWLPLTLKLGLIFSQLVLLVMPARVVEQDYAPAFIVLLLDGLMGVSDPTRQAEQILMLGGGIIVAWVLAWLLGWWVKKTTAQRATPPPAEAEE